MNPYPHHILTPADIQDLRSSCHVRGSPDGTSGHFGAAFIVWGPSDDTFHLHAYGQIWASHRDIAILAQMLRCERAEAGFIRRVLSSIEPCTIASLAPDKAAEVRSRIAAEHRAQAAFAQSQREALSRRASHFDPSKISLDDI